MKSQISKRFRRVFWAALCLLGLTACGSLGGEHGNQPAPKPATTQAPSAVQDYPAMTAEQWLGLSRTLYQDGKYVESIGAAQTSLYLKPDYAEAYNNIGAAYAALHLWDPAILADQQAVRADPKLQIARNNLAWALTQKNLAQK